MLTLTIKDGGSFRVGDAIIHIEKPRSGKQVKVHIDAPPEIKVLRSELEVRQS